MSAKLCVYAVGAVLLAVGSTPAGADVTHPRGPGHTAETISSAEIGLPPSVTDRDAGKTTVGGLGPAPCLQSYRKFPVLEIGFRTGTDANGKQPVTPPQESVFEIMVNAPSVTLARSVMTALRHVPAECLATFVKTNRAAKPGDLAVAPALPPAAQGAADSFGLRVTFTSHFTAGVSDKIIETGHFQDDVYRVGTHVLITSATTEVLRYSTRDKTQSVALYDTVASRALATRLARRAVKDA